MQPTQIQYRLPFIVCIGLAVAIIPLPATAQTPRILFDASKAEMAGNADWVVEANIRNIAARGESSLTHAV